MSTVQRILDEWRCDYGLLGTGGGRFAYFN